MIVVFCQMLFFLLFTFSFAKNHRRGADGDDSAVFDGYTIAVAENFVHEESSGSRGAVAEDEAHFSLLVDVRRDAAMGSVNAGIDGLDCGVGIRTTNVATDDVFALIERNFLTQMESILDDNEVAELLLFFLLFFFVPEIMIGVARCEFLIGNAYLELLAAVRALEDEDTAGSVEGVVKEDGFIALRTAYAFHFVDV